MIELFEDNLEIFSEYSSKGNQLKWKERNVWYKADYTGYEGLAEYVVSNLLKKSSLSESEYVIYDPVQIKYKRSVFNGASSHDFLPEKWQIITLERLYQARYGREFTKDVWHINSGIKSRLDYLVDTVVKITGLSDFGIYINKMLTIDAIFLNEDRHLHNIAVLMGPDGGFDYCPFFDHGAGLLADTTLDYPLAADVYELMDSVRGKTVCNSLNDALDASEELYGVNLTFEFTAQDVRDILSKVDIYSDEVRKRVETVVLEQMRKYTYLMGSDPKMDSK